MPTSKQANPLEPFGALLVFDDVSVSVPGPFSYVIKTFFTVAVPQHEVLKTQEKEM